MVDGGEVGEASGVEVEYLLVCSEGGFQGVIINVGEIGVEVAEAAEAGTS